MGDTDTARKGRSTEEIIVALREAEVEFGQGETVGKICKAAAAFGYALRSTGGAFRFPRSFSASRCSFRAASRPARIQGMQRLRFEPRL